MDTSTQSIQVRDRERRRFRTVEEKRRIVEEALQPGASVARVARAYGVNANQLFCWRRLYLQGQLESRNGQTPGLLAVRVAHAAREASPRSQASASGDTIEIELSKGRIRIVGKVDPASLQTALEYLAR